MKISGISNQQTFGIKYNTAREHWSKKVLKSFEGSKLFEQLNKKYPEASVGYCHYNISNVSEGPYEYVSSLTIYLGSGQGDKRVIEAYSSKKKVPDNLIISKIEEINLSDLEESTKIECETTTQENNGFFSSMLKKIFLRI